MTNEICGEFCAGYVYYGTEYGIQCWCGNVLKGGSAPAQNPADCNSRCGGDQSETCGGGDRLSVYRDLTRPQPSIYQGNARFGYIGCYQEPDRGRLLTYEEDQSDTSMTIQRCFDRCPDYQYVGLEVGSECWCDNTIHYNGDPDNTVPGKQVADYDCDKTCTGDATTLCGSHLKLTMYQRRDTGGIP